MRAPWKLRLSSPYPVYERSLGLNELHFYLRGRVLHGATDNAHSVCFEVLDDGTPLITEETVCKAWVFAKQMHPLLGAQVETVGDRDEDVHFIVDEHRLKAHIPGEVIFMKILSFSDADATVENILNQERILDDNHLVRLFVLRQSDQKNWFHFVVHAAHCVIDGVSHYTVVRTLLAFLSSPPVAAPRLSERLALSLAVNDLYPVRRLSPATQRWHKAMAHVIASIRSGKIISGGHTLPGNVTVHMNENPADSRRTTLSFTVEETLRIMKICRDHGLTFGNVYVVLGQIAMGRLLCRRYAQGLITEEEWEFRKREPTYTAGPVNVRPYLDREWYTHGGAENPMLSIGFYLYPLSFVPLYPEGGHSTFGALLSCRRFWYRCRNMKKRADDFLKHPLFLDIGSVRYPPMINTLKELEFKAHSSHTEKDLSIPAIEQAKLGVVPSFGGSSFGSVDKLLPREFPVGGKTPKIYLHWSGTRLRCRPGEIYLGASTFRDELELVVLWDNNVTEEAIIEEWLQEVKRATSYYLLENDREEAKL
ncbi:uncharacterized protein BT62DRAFT_946652 [Guyanagaster necrorhizus]|uniref:Condensation domain-containing protein n=1 Tax=Guyanagaster necrorhizus TaxID=856835 RepID=A0A9P7VY00_9AGAR|nr:uncharacterized protein BT62DRAFT_946652 [Guyanagaster necrorhizus MCA 3950]KAG7447896.1 hypothetical protein BT62DRAFT_946652 [Guyanagaster necrorhizus MCA 3950]